MQVNTSIWGAPETWVNGSTSEQKASIKFAESSRDTYRENYENGNIDLNSIDLSPCYWGIGKGSIFRNPHYLSPYLLDGETKVAIDDVLDDSQTSFPLMFFTASSVTNQETRFNYRYSPRRTTSPPQAVPFSTKIVLGFRYKDIILEPIVLCKDNTFASSNRFATLYSYIENAVYETYPRITGIGYTSYAGDGSVNRSKIYFYPLTTYAIKEYDLYYGTNYFWCQYLSNFLMNGVEIGTTQNPTIGATHTLTTTDINNLIGDSVTALAYKYSANESTRVPFYYFDTENELWQINKTVIRSGSEKWYPYPYIEVTAENAETVRNYVLSQIAYLGLPFVYDPSKSAQGQIGDIGVFLPVFDQNGVTTGDYAEGTNALRLPNAQWVDGRESGYDPNHPTDEGDYGDLSNRIPSRFAVGGLGLYVTNYQTLYSLQQFLNGTYAPTQDALTADFKGTNPQDYIISIQKYPSDALLPTSATQSDIYIGKIDSTFDAYKLIEPPGTQLGHYSFGELTVGSGQIPIYGDFRDYQSKITLLMPFVGTAELDPRLYVGHSIGLEYVIDYLTGSVAAEIKRDGLTVETKTSKLSITVPFLAGNMGQYQNQLAQLEMSIEQSKIKQITGAVTTVFSIGGAAATVAGGGSELAGLGSGAGIIRGASNMLLERINQESLEYQVEHTQPSVGTISTASPGNAFEMDDRARLLIWRPYMLAGYDAAIYSHVVGNATLRAAQLSSFTGLTVAAAAELSGIYTIDGTKAATEQELQMIKRALLAGVYV